MCFRFLSIFVVATVLTACAGQPQQQTLSSDPQNNTLPVIATDGGGDTTATSNNNNEVASSSGSTDSGFSASSVQETGDDSSNVPGSAEDFRNTAKDTVFFATNEHYVSNEASRILRAQAKWLRKYPEKRILIEGNCDERGTREYNYALGNRRAFAVRDFLISQGIPSYRIKTVSYGKDKPEFLGSNETSWSLNRRAVTVILE